jgi:hypothetical protein
LNTIPVGSKSYEATKELARANGTYEDPEFPHNHQSLGKLRLENIVWKRPHEIFKTEYENIYIFDNIEPADIRQGYLNSCYLLSVLASLAEYPERIMSIFMNKRVNPHGCYGITMYVRGVPTEIVFDDWLPCIEENENMTPIFSHPNGKELWVVLLEKAWAKLFGDYSIAEYGLSNEVWEYLLGIPGMVYEIDYIDTELLWAQMLEAEKLNFVMTGSTRESAT